MMQIAAGLLEGTEQALAGQVAKATGAHRGKAEASRKKAETGEFQKYLKKVNETSKEEKAEEEKEPEHTERTAAELLFLFPQLVSANLGEEASAGSEEGSAVMTEGGLDSIGLTGLTPENFAPGAAGVAPEAVATTEEVTAADPAETTIPVEAGEAMEPAETIHSLEASGESIDTKEGILPAEEFSGFRESKEVSPDKTAQPTIGAAEDELSASVGVDETGFNGSRSEEEGVISGREGSEELFTALAGRQAKVRIGGKGQKQQAQTSLAKEGRAFDKQVDRALQERRPASLTKDVAGQTGEETFIKDLAESGEKSIVRETGVRTNKTHGRQSTEQGRLIYSPLEGANTPAEPAEEIPVSARQMVNRPTEETLTAQIISKAKLMVKNGLTKVELQLEPAELGKLELSLVVERDLVAARFVAENKGVQFIIEANLPQLRTSLEEAGLRVDLLQVGVQNGSNYPQQQEATAGREHFKRDAGWAPSVEFYGAEEGIFTDDGAWHGMVNLRV